MNRPNKNSPSMEATLDDLYANEMNIALSWGHGRGFHAVLGNPPLAKKSLPTSEEAVRWLKDQALRQFPRAEFRQPHKPGDADRDAILDHLCGSHIPGSISWIWDGGFYARIGEPMLAEKWSAGSAGEVVDWLREQALVHYARSEFARQYAGFGPTPPART